MNDSQGPGKGQRRHSVSNTDSSVVARRSRRGSEPDSLDVRCVANIERVVTSNIFDKLLRFYKTNWFSLFIVFLFKSKQNCVEIFCSRIIHEAFQFLILKKKKLSGRSLAESWNIVGGKATLMGLLNRVEERDQSGVESAQSREADDKRNTKQWRNDDTRQTILTILYISHNNTLFYTSFIANIISIFWTRHKLHRFPTFIWWSWLVMMSVLKWQLKLIKRCACSLHTRY